MSASPSSPAQVCFALIPRFNMAGLTTTIEPMRVTNYLSSEQRYEWGFFSAEGGEVQASNGMTVKTQRLDDAPSKPLLAFVCGSWGSEHYEHPHLTRWLKRMHRRAVQLAAMELGIYAIARAGLIGDHAVARRHMPGHDLRILQAFAEIWQVERAHACSRQSCAAARIRASDGM